MNLLDLLRDALNHLSIDENTAQSFIDSEVSTYADLESIYNSIGNDEKMGGFANPIMNRLSDAISERVLGQIVDEEK